MASPYAVHTVLYMVRMQNVYLFTKNCRGKRVKRYFQVKESDI